MKMNLIFFNVPTPSEAMTDYTAYRCDDDNDVFTP